VETGSNNIDFSHFYKDPSLDQNRITQCHSVINLRKDGMGILIMGHDRQNVLAIADFEWPATTDPHQSLAFIEKNLLTLEFNLEESLSLQWIWSGSKVSLVPQELYEEGKAYKALELTCRPSKDENVASDVWTKPHIISVYLVPGVLQDWVKHNFDEHQLIHSSTALHGLSQLYEHDEVFALLYVEHNYAEFYLSMNGRPVFYNQFTYAVEEDLLYYLLFALEQNRILAPEINLRVAGKAPKGKKLYTLLSEYIGTVEPLPIAKAFKLSPDLSKEQFRTHILLAGSL
tara:strand:- start:937 stop:1797 length:861 start_codon:yes stop_codon:yes gene_type:complete